MLEAASCGDPPELIGLVSKMAAYHVVPAPATAEVMCAFGVVATRAGELPVEACGDGGGNDVGTATLYVNGARLIRSYQFEDNLVQNYQDADGNLLGSETMEGGARCIVHEVEGFVCPSELWNELYSHYQSSGLGAT